MKASIFLIIILIALFSFYSLKPNGETCSTAIIMPNSANPELTGQTQNTGQRWYKFIPQTPEIKIILTNTEQGSNHIHDIILSEGSCRSYRNVGYDSSRTDKTLTIILHEAIVGTPYFISTFRERTNCSMCSPPANFNLMVQSLPTTIQTVSNGVVYFNGRPSHESEQVIIRVDKKHLNARNVNNKSLISGKASQFFDKTIIKSIAHLLYNDDIKSAKNLPVKKAYPKMTFADTVSISRDNRPIRVPDFFEVFVLGLPQNTTIFRASRQLSMLPGVKYAEPNFVLSSMSN
jgi:hypothetical protein